MVFDGIDFAMVSPIPARWSGRGIEDLGLDVTFSLLLSVLFHVGVGVDGEELSLCEVGKLVKLDGVGLFGTLVECLDLQHVLIEHAHAILILHTQGVEFVLAILDFPVLPHATDVMGELDWRISRLSEDLLNARRGHVLGGT